MPLKLRIPPHHFNIRNQDGVTLVEIVIASLILTVGLVALLSATVDVGKSRALIEQEEMASSVLASTAEVLRGADLEQAARGNLIIPQLLGDSQSISFAYLNSAGMRVPLAAAAGETFSAQNFPNPLNVEIILSWRDVSSRPLSRRLTVLLGR